MHQTRQVVLPVGVVEHRFDQAEGVGVGVEHHPPPVIFALGGEDQAAAGVGQAVAQFLLRLGEFLLALRQVVDALDDEIPVDQRAGWQTQRVDVQRRDGTCRFLPLPRQRLQDIEAAVEQGVAARRRPFAGLDASFRIGGQALQHALPAVFGEGEAGQRRQVEQVGGQRGAAGRAGEVRGQPVVVELARQALGDGLPACGVVQAHSDRGLLLQAGERIAFEEAAHARRDDGQFRRQSDFQAALAGQGARRQGDTDLVFALDARETGLLHRHRYGGRDLLHDLQRVLGVAAFLARAEFPFLLRDAFAGFGFPAQFGGAFGVDGDLPFGQRRLAVAGGDAHRHVARGAVAQGEHGLEIVAFAHQRRQAGDDLQVLPGAHAAAAGAEQTSSDGGDTDQAEFAQRIVHRHLQRRAAVGVELDTRLPAQQRVEQFARRRAAAATAGRQGFLAEVALADHLRLRRRRFDAVAAFLQ